MQKPQAIFVVGHSNWGKSHTLRALTGGLHRYVTIKDVLFHIRRMSNDDLPTQLLAFIRALDPTLQTAILMALCPNFTDSWAKTEEMLSIIQRKGYRMHFFVIKQQFASGRCIAPDEISRLKVYGNVHVYTKAGEATERAAELRRFMIRAVERSRT